MKLSTKSGIAGVLLLALTAVQVNSQEEYVYIDCPEFLDFDYDDGEYCSTNYATKNTISCKFEVCGDEHFYVQADDSEGKVYTRLQLASGETISTEYSGLAIEIFRPIGSSCESYEAVLGCYEDDTSCSGSLFIFGSGQSVSQSDCLALPCFAFSCL
jgi:hypothetical protein